MDGGSSESISKKFICPRPWITTCVTTDGHFRVCSEAQSSGSRGVVRDDLKNPISIDSVSDLGSLMNAETLKNLRKGMMTGADISDTCARCLNEEKFGIESARIKSMRHFPDFDVGDIATYTQPDGTLDHIDRFQGIIFRLGNKCNLSCRMCGPASSTSWYREWKETRYSGFQEASGRVSLRENSNNIIEAYPNPYAWVDNGRALELLKLCGNKIKSINFSGGEPLFNRGHLEILRYLVSTGLSAQVVIDYNTNLTVLPTEVIELWSHFKMVYVGVSLDGSPAVNEYIRHGSNTMQIVKNLRALNESNIKGVFWISPTVQIYNVFNLLELESWFRGLHLERFSQEIIWHILRSPPELSIYALPLKVKRKVASHLQSSENFAAIAESIFSLDLSGEFPIFIKATQRMDKYRNQSIEDLGDLWPQVSEFYKSED